MNKLNLKAGAKKDLKAGFFDLIERKGGGHLIPKTPKEIKDTLKGLRQQQQTLTQTINDKLSRPDEIPTDEQMKALAHAQQHIDDMQQRLMEQLKYLINEKLKNFLKMSLKKKPGANPDALKKAEEKRLMNKYVNNDADPSDTESLDEFEIHNAPEAARAQFKLSRIHPVPAPVKQPLVGNLRPPTPIPVRELTPEIQTVEEVETVFEPATEEDTEVEVEEVPQATGPQEVELMVNVHHKKEKKPKKALP